MAAEFILDGNTHYLRLTEKTNIVTFKSQSDSVKNYNLVFNMGGTYVHQVVRAQNGGNPSITGTDSNITFPSGRLRLSQNPAGVDTISSNIIYLDDGGGGDFDLDDLIIGAIYGNSPPAPPANQSNSGLFYFSGPNVDNLTDVRNYKFKLSSVSENGSIINPPPSPTLQSYDFTVSKEANHRNIIRFRAYVPDFGTHEFYIDSNQIGSQNTNTTLTRSVYSNVEYSLSYESLFNIVATGSFESQSTETYTSTQTTGNLLILGGSQIGNTNLYAYPGQQYVPVIGQGIKTKNDNIWKTPLKEYVKHNGEWKEVQASWVKQNNEWKKVFPLGNNWINFIEPGDAGDDYLDFAVQVIAVN